MNYKMKRRLRRAGALAFAAIFAMGIPCAEVEASSNSAFSAETAAENSVEELELTLVESSRTPESGPTPRTMMMNCYITYSCSSSGITATLHTGTSQTASVLGVKDVKVEKLFWYGWDTVGYADPYEVTNAASLSCSFTYSSAEYGKTYRISCTHYGNVDGYEETETVTSSFVYEY
ncbi:MAG: hypothetical protein J6C84_01170 [Lachnospiraceae bacterium]|nr:hypothetical protein [Lachnospiraceae bacterium]